LCPKELDRDKRAVWVVLMAYGCGFGLRARSGVLSELRSRSPCALLDVPMKQLVDLVGLDVIANILPIGA